MEFSQITDYLYIAPRKKLKDIQEIEKMNVGLILDMVFHSGPPRELEELKIDVLSLPAVDFILMPIPIRLLNRRVEAALPVIDDGRQVISYCQAGRHRSVAMACCILIAKGYTAEEAMALVKEKRKKADPYAWHIQRQIKKYEIFWVEQALKVI